MFSEPVVGERFFGRTDILELLDKRVSALKDGYRQNIALTGQSLAGKTSILHHFLHSVQDEDLVTVYVEVIKEPFRSFAKRFMATLLYNSLTKIGENCGFDIEELFEKARVLLPRTYAAIKNINSCLDKSDLDEAYFNLLGLTSTLKDEVKMSCVVILDEFDNLEHIGVKNPFLNFGKVIMIQKDTMYIVSSSRNQVIKKILSERLSLLFGNFEIVKVSGFDMQTAKLFIDSHLARFEIDDILKRFLISFTDGNPFYLNHIAEKTKEIAAYRMSNYIDADIIADAIIELIYNANGIIHQYLLNFILDLIDTKHKERYISLLAVIANGNNRLFYAAKAARMKQCEVSKDLAQLAELGFLSKNGVFYTIDDSILEFWLKFVYQKRKELLVDGLLNRREISRAQAVSYISDFVAMSKAAVITKAAELFNSFSNELVQIDSKQLRLPHFTKIEILETRESKSFIAASFRGKTWLIQPYEEAVDENDIINYVRNAKSRDYRIANKIIIPLRGIDENARLLAKELKISIWDSSTLNNLSRIYGKKRMVI